ncbi:hypothetical protein E0198_002333 [Clavispora lusitaniae]|nr:hypothetical protein E0198_002333 [Clavispora lusitaniae]
MFLQWLAFYVFAAVVGAGCVPSSVLGTGFNAVAYRYPLASKTGWDTNFLQDGYKSGGQVFSISGLTNIDFSFTIRNNLLKWGTLYGQPLTISNFTIEYTGYFVPDASGVYTWSIDSADDGAALSLVTVGGCCDNVDSVTSQFSISTLRGFAGAGDASAKTTQAYLEKGFAYALKIVTFNWNGPSALAVSYTTPDGQTVSDFNLVQQLSFDPQNCAVPPVVTTTTSYGTNSLHPTTGFYTPTDCSSVPTCTIVEVPPQDFTTVTESGGTPGTYTPTDCSVSPTCTVTVVPPQTTT